MTSVLPPSASEDDEYASNRQDARPAKSEHELFVATRRKSPVPVVLAVVVALLVILGTVLAVTLVWSGRLL